MTIDPARMVTVMRLRMTMVMIWWIQMERQVRLRPVAVAAVVVEPTVAVVATFLLSQLLVAYEVNIVPQTPPVLINTLLRSSRLTPRKLS